MRIRTSPLRSLAAAIVLNGAAFIAYLTNLATPGDITWLGGEWVILSFALVTLGILFSLYRGGPDLDQDLDTFKSTQIRSDATDSALRPRKIALVVALVGALALITAAALWGIFTATTGISPGGFIARTVLDRSEAKTR